MRPWERGTQAQLLWGTISFKLVTCPAAGHGAATQGEQLPPQSATIPQGRALPWGPHRLCPCRRGPKGRCRGHGDPKGSPAARPH